MLTRVGKLQNVNGQLHARVGLHVNVAGNLGKNGGSQLRLPWEEQPRRCPVMLVCNGHERELDRLCGCFDLLHHQFLAQIIKVKWLVLLLALFRALACLIASLFAVQLATIT